MSRLWRIANALSALVPVGQLRMWSRSQWRAALGAYLVALAVMGGLGETLPGASAGRVVPVQWWNYLTLAVSPLLIALIAGSFVADRDAAKSRRRTKGGAAVGGAIGTVAMACPVCNPIAIPLFGTAGVLSFLAPERGVMALVSVGLLALTLVLRLRGAGACPAVHASGSSLPRVTAAPDRAAAPAAGERSCPDPNGMTELGQRRSGAAAD